MRCRGEIDVKGKGKMTTYFLLGKKTNELNLEPNDDYKMLPIVSQNGTDDYSDNCSNSKEMRSKRVSSTCRIV